MGCRNPGRSISSVWGPWGFLQIVVPIGWGVQVNITRIQAKSGHSRFIKERDLRQHSLVCHTSTHTWVNSSKPKRVYLTVYCSSQEKAVLWGHMLFAFIINRELGDGPFPQHYVKRWPKQEIAPARCYNGTLESVVYTGIVCWLWYPHRKKE